MAGSSDHPTQETSARIMFLVDMAPVKKSFGSCALMPFGPAGGNLNLQLDQRCLLTIMRLLLQGCNGTAKCINGLRGLKLSQLLAEAPVKLQLLVGEFA